MIFATTAEPASSKRPADSRAGCPVRLVLLAQLSSTSSTVWLHGPVGSDPLRKSLVARTGWFRSTTKESGCTVRLVRLQWETHWSQGLVSGSSSSSINPVPVGDFL
ncbi:unnamed protein product [Sphagnum jensenii]|uniref:Uncharacterized protein n=1 Tax=Sphagnum jensenii TaxID=128206 RepID=A0ABP1AQD3_9BRYO